MISSKNLLGFVVVALCIADVYGHGCMTKPDIRPITAKYRSECYFGLKGAGDEELQIAPLELLSTRIQADQPTNPMFDMMNGCRGTVYEPGNPVTEVTPGQNVPIEYRIQAPHPGYLEMGIVKSETAAGGKIMYKRVTVLSRTENFATSSTSTPLSVTIPSNVTGCSNPGDCALQFYWHSDIAKQTYVTCADIVVKGSGGSPPAAPTPAGPSPAGPSPDSPTPATPTGPSPATPVAPTGLSPASPSPATPSPDVYPANTPPNTPAAPTPNTPTAPTPDTPGAPTPNTPAAPTPNTPATPSPRKKCTPRRK